MSLPPRRSKRLLVITYFVSCCAPRISADANSSDCRQLVLFATDTVLCLEEEKISRFFRNLYGRRQLWRTGDIPEKFVTFYDFFSIFFRNIFGILAKIKWPKSEEKTDFGGR